MVISKMRTFNQEHKLRLQIGTQNFSQTSSWRLEPNKTIPSNLI